MRSESTREIMVNKVLRRRNLERAQDGCPASDNVSDRPMLSADNISDLGPRPPTCYRRPATGGALPRAPFFPQALHLFETILLVS